MKIVVKIDVDAVKIMKHRGLDEGGRVQQYMAERAKALMDPYVPMQSGALKDPQIIDNGKALLFNRPYAHYQYVGEVYGPNIPLGDGTFFSPTAPKQATGRSLQYRGAPMRGKEWDKRMMADKGEEFARDVENFIKAQGG